jgi:hypothetical protein
VGSPPGNRPPAAPQTSAQRYAYAVAMGPYGLGSRLERDHDQPSVWGGRTKTPDCVHIASDLGLGEMTDRFLDGWVPPHLWMAAGVPCGSSGWCCLARCVDHALPREVVCALIAGLAACDAVVGVVAADCCQWSDVAGA